MDFVSVPNYFTAEKCSAPDTAPEESPAKGPRLHIIAVHPTRRMLFVPGAGGEKSPAVTSQVHIVVYYT